MLCSKCGKNEASVHMVTEINGVRSDRHLCMECAQADGSVTNLFRTGGFFGGFFDMTSLLAQMAAAAAPVLNCAVASCEPTSGNSEPVCSLFDSAILPVLRRCGVQEDEKAGEKTVEKEPSELAKLQDQLKVAIREERFEDCAILRDKIAQLKQGGDN